MQSTNNLFIETIRIADNKIHNLSFHQQRVDDTFSRFFAGTPAMSLSEILQDAPLAEHTVKARIVYGIHGLVDISYSDYHRRNIASIALVCCNDIEYSYKSADRSNLQRLVAMNDDYDEIIIVKNGLLTDTSYSNIALSDGKQWVTPRHPLLRGTMRNYLIMKKLLVERDISVDDLGRYQHIELINAMMPHGSLILPLGSIQQFNVQ